MKVCQACKANWLDNAPYCEHCGFHAYVLVGVTAQHTQALKAIRQTEIDDLQQDREKDRQRLIRARTLMTKLLRGYETLYTGTTLFDTDLNFEQNLADTHDFLRDLDKSLSA